MVITMQRYKNFVNMQQIRAQKTHFDIKDYRMTPIVNAHTSRRHASGLFPKDGKPHCKRPSIAMQKAVF